MTRISNNTIQTLTFLTFLFFPCYLNAMTIEDFATKSQYRDAKLSPDGKHIVASYDTGKKVRLYFFRLKDMKMVGNHSLGKNIPGEFHWVNNERIVVEVLHEQVGKENLANYGELYAVNLNGRRGKYIFGYSAKAEQTNSRIKKADNTYAWGGFLDILPNDKKHILIVSKPYSSTVALVQSIYKLNVYTGVQRLVTRGPVPNSNFLTDNNSKVKLADSLSSDRVRSVYLKRDKNDWVKLRDVGKGRYFEAVTFTKDKKQVYVMDNSQSDTVGLYKLDLINEKLDEVYVNPDVDISDYLLSSDKKRIIALEIDRTTPQYIILSPEDEEAIIFKNMTIAFAGHRIRITSKSKNGDRYVVRVSGDTNPGIYYLYDRAKNTLRPIFTAHQSVDKSSLSYVEPYSFESSDGLTINGYLTLPKNAKKKLSPLVVVIHGGPQSRDIWTYNSEVQMLAYHGFAVLQVNFRGSSGYGNKFELAGNREWGGMVQSDIIEATRWAVKNPRIDANRTCIMGSSFGAYSAVFSAIKEPELYDCVIANAGAYDLELYYDDDKDGFFGTSFLDEMIGSDESQWNDYSPVNFVEQLKAPILIIHGTKDSVAPLEHAEKLKVELDKYNKRYDWFIKKREGHGFFANKNRIQSYKKIISFLSKELDL